jgi:hypothetical protein
MLQASHQWSVGSGQWSGVRSEPVSPDH